MKNLFVILCVFVLLTSCTMVRYENPQPKNVVALKKFPEQMHGTYISEEQDTLQIDSLSFQFRNGEEINMLGNLSSAETVLKQSGKYYVINLYEEDGWDVFLVRVKKNKITIYFTSLSSNVEDLMEDLKATSPVQEVIDSTGNLKYYLIDPRPEAFRDLIQKRLYNEKLIFDRMD
jgi:hypothetical protein